MQVGVRTTMPEIDTTLNWHDRNSHQEEEGPCVVATTSPAETCHEIKSSG
jgi:hypothetical protein